MKAFNCPNCGAAVPAESPSCCYCGSSIAARHCPACFGAVSVGMRHCPHCGAEVADSGSANPASFRCPRCETGLGLCSVGNKPLLTCLRCGGIWLSKDTFQKICTGSEEQESVLAFKTEPARPQPPSEQKARRAYIPCPECGKLMNHKNFSGSGTVLDWCRDHGSWFDRDELQQIVRFIRDGGLRKARERDIERLKDEENRLKAQEFKMAVLERRLSLGSTEDRSSTESILDFLPRMF